MQRNSIHRSRITRLLQTFTLLAVVIAGIRTGYAQGANGQLPSGFHPPKPIPKFFQVEDELVTEDEYDDWRKKESPKYRDALSSRSLDGVVDGRPVKDRITQGIAMRVKHLSLKSERNNLSKLRRELVQQDLNFYANKNEDVRIFALTQTVNEAQKLLVGNFQVRLHAILVVSELDLRPKKIGPGAAPALAFDGGLDMLLSVVTETLEGKDVPQPEAIKIPAVRGLQRILTEGPIPKQPNEKRRIATAKALLKQLQGKNSPAYEWVLIDALANVGLPTIVDDQGAPKPEVVTALARLMVDPSKSLRNRCRAARMLGRTPIPGGINAAPINFGIAQLGHLITSQYGTARLQPKFAYFCLQDLYYAYVPPPGESTSDGKSRGGLNSTLKDPSTAEAYKAVRTVLVSILRAIGNSSTLPEALPQAMSEGFAEIKKPASMSLKPGEPPIDQKKSRSPEERPGPPAG